MDPRRAAVDALVAKAAVAVPDAPGLWLFSPGPDLSLTGRALELAGWGRVDDATPGERSMI